MISYREDQHCIQVDGTKVRYQIFEETLFHMIYKGKRQHIPDEFTPDDITNMAEIFTSQVDADEESLVKVHQGLEKDALDYHNTAFQESFVKALEKAEKKEEKG